MYNNETVMLQTIEKMKNLLIVKCCEIFRTALSGHVLLTCVCVLSISIHAIRDHGDITFLFFTVIRK